MIRGGPAERDTCEEKEDGCGPGESGRSGEDGTHGLAVCDEIALNTGVPAGVVLSDIFLYMAYSPRLSIPAQRAGLYVCVLRFPLLPISLLNRVLACLLRMPYGAGVSSFRVTRGTDPVHPTIFRVAYRNSDRSVR